MDLMRLSSKHVIYKFSILNMEKLQFFSTVAKIMIPRYLCQWTCHSSNKGSCKISFYSFFILIFNLICYKTVLTFKRTWEYKRTRLIVTFFGLQVLNSQENRNWYKKYIQKTHTSGLMLTVGSIESIFFSYQQNLNNIENKPKTKQKELI